MSTDLPVEASVCAPSPIDGLAALALRRLVAALARQAAQEAWTTQTAPHSDCGDAG